MSADLPFILLSDSPLLRLFVENFPLPAAMAIDDKISLANSAWAKVFGSSALDDLTEVSVSAVEKIFAEGDDDMNDLKDTNDIDMENIACPCPKNEYDLKKSCLQLGQNKIQILALEKACMPATDRQAAADYADEDLRALLVEQICASLGRSPAMRIAVTRAVDFICLNVNIVIYGERGTGKTFLSQLLSKSLASSGMSILTLDCAKLFPEQDDLQKELSEGYDVICLLNMELLSPDNQKRLVAYLNDHKNITLICTSSKNPLEMARKGELLDQLFALIFVGDVYLPPLRSRKEDISYLARIFFEQYGLADVPSDILRGYEEKAWPGNAEELKQFILDYVLREQTGDAKAVCPNEDDEDNNLNLEHCLEETERKCILRALSICQGRKDRAAQMLGMNLRTFHRRCARLEI